MAKFRKKPVIIEAFQYDGDLMNANGEYYVPEWAQDAHKKGTIFFDSMDSESQPSEMFIKTLEGDHHASVGDYIIQGVNGELYPCKPEIFEKTYENLCEDTLKQLVQKEDTLARKIDDETLQPYEVVSADSQVFIIAPISYDEEQECYMTDYGKLESYSNDPSVNSLEDLHFKLCD